MAGRQDINDLWQGEDVALTFNLTDAGAPLVITGWAISFRVGLRGNEAIITKSATIVGDGSAGQITVALTAAELALVGKGYVYEVRRTDASNVRTLVVGNFVLNDSLFVAG
jgi:hypothetical protein